MKRCLLFLFFVIALGAYAQGVEPEQPADSLIMPLDSLADAFDEDDVRDAVALPDTLAVSKRDFDAAKIEDLKADPQLRYKEPPTVAETLWDRIKQWLSEFFSELFEGGIDTNIGKLFLFLLAMVVVIVLIMIVLRVNAFRLFYSGEGATTFAHNVLDENIHAMDFDKLIQQAIARGDYRGGVRLVFLQALKMLADKNHIHWERGKTNHDYLAELSQADLKQGFHDLNYYFEYAWYGNFSIDQAMFATVQHTFNQWKGKLK